LASRLKGSLPTPIPGESTRSWQWVSVRLVLVGREASRRRRRRVSCSSGGACLRRWVVSVQGVGLSSGLVQGGLLPWASHGGRRARCIGAGQRRRGVVVGVHGARRLCRRGVVLLFRGGERLVQGRVGVLQGALCGCVGLGRGMSAVCRRVMFRGVYFPGHGSAAGGRGVAVQVGVVVQRSQ
jgi:hypothetical protein